jgi:hypothetical protein
MGLFDAFSASKGTAVAGQTRQAQKKAIKKSEKKAEKQEDRSLMAYEKGIPLATAAYEKGETKAVPALQQAETKQVAELNKARGDITGAQTQQLAALDQAAGVFDPLAQDANKAYDLYGNFYGVGGQQGFDTAQGQWEASPLYQAMVGEGSQGMQALDRQAASRGNPYNATDILQYQGDLAGRYLPQYTSGLWNMAGQAPEIAGAQANVYGRQADVYGQTGRDLATIQGDMSNVYGQTGRDLATVYQGTANNIGNLYNTAMTNVSSNFQNNADRRMQTGTQMAGIEGQYGQNVAAANAGAAANQWGAILGVAGLGADLGSAALGRPRTV